VTHLYDNRLGERRAAAAALAVRERRISILRLFLIAAAIGLGFVHPLLILVPVAVFIPMLVVHERVSRGRKRAESGATFYERGLGRIHGEWQGRGVSGEEFAEEHHPYAGDFDLFGKGSVFELICIAVTRAGKVRLASWLKQPSQSAVEIRERQEAVQELRDHVDLREDLAVASAAVVREVESARLDAWGALPPVAFARWERVAMLVVPALATLAVLAALPAVFAAIVRTTHPEAVLRLGVFANVPLWPLLLLIVLLIAMHRHAAPRVVPIIVAVERAEPALALLASVLARIERETFRASRLVALRAALGPSASNEIETLRRLVALLDARRNQFFIPIGGLLLWTPNLAVAIEGWRQRSGTHIGAWIEAVGEIEALASLASFAYEHPEFTMPSIETAAPLFDARQLGHPLIPADRRVANDIRLDGTLRLFVVSGSNMSGKSTMMRSVGIGAVLAMAGSVVCAKSLRIAPMKIGASIRINDSLHEGASRFYAEILRIRQVLEMASRGEPMLFLLDEVLAGTNSHDRRIGAEAIVKGLVERGAVGLVSTHDLALAQIAESLAPRAANVHFEDHLEGDKVVFDYRMRPGVVTRSNALELMRSVGIEV
jgi:hypothetical protein